MEVILITKIKSFLPIYVQIDTIYLCTHAIVNKNVFTWTHIFVVIDFVIFRGNFDTHL